MQTMIRTATVFSIAMALSSCDSILEIKSASGSTVDVAKDRSFSITLGTSPTVSPEYAYSWGEPEVTGDAVKFERKTSDPKAGTAPGSSGGLIYVFKAVQAGESNIVIKLKAGPKVERGSDFTLRVRVK